MKFIITEDYENATSFMIHDHHLIKGSKVVTFHILTSTETYSKLMSKIQNKQSSDIYFENLFNDYNVLYMLPYNTYKQSFQNKIF